MRAKRRALRSAITLERPSKSLKIECGHLLCKAGTCPACFRMESGLKKAALSFPARSNRHPVHLYRVLIALTIHPARYEQQARYPALGDAERSKQQPQTPLRA